MASRATSPRRLQTQNSFKKQESGMDSPLHTGRHPLRPIPESSTKSSSTSEQTEPGSPSKPPTPRGKKRAAAVYRQSENVDGNIGSASNTPEKPREKRTNLSRVGKLTAPWPSKLPVTNSLARSLQESLQQTDAANKSWDSDSTGGTPTTSVRTPAISTTGASKVGSTYQTPRTASFSGKPPLDSEPSKVLVSSSNSSFLQSTPSRSVNRSLRYGATPGSAASIGSTRAPGNGKPPGSFQFFTGQQTAAQQFDFEEDPTFWEDHNVQVILRTRPISTSESAVKGFSRCVRQENSHSITWIGQPETRFTFDHVAGEHITQENLFRVAGVPMVENCMAGYNSCMFCYGQTGSGKTHTMLGDIVDLEHRPSDDRGITPRVFEYLFSRIQKEEEARATEHLKYICKCSFLEIFNEQITDLLEPTSTNLQVREGGKKGVYVENLSEVAVGSVQDVVHLLLLGAANRKVAATNMNRESSRSHSVFTCTIESKWEFNSMTNIRFGRLNLVDLAGSERQKTSGAEGERLKEAANINKSLSTLGLVIMVLVDVANGKQRHVPYRDSKLTYVLQDSLGGNSKTTMIANISPSSCCALETLSTLKFAQRAKFIRNNAVVNGDASGDVNGLRQEIQELKEELNRMRRQDLPRTPSMHSIASIDQDSVRKGDNHLGMTIVAVDEQEHSRCSLDSWDFGKALSGPRFPYKKLEAMEAVLAGALRREQEAELSQKRQAAEIEQLTRLVKQREDDNQCSKMVLRFREDKIARLEALSAGTTSSDIYLRQERDWLMNELRLMQEKTDRNPELTRFAMENIRLLEQLRRFQDFYTGGEREAMADEISNLRDQLLDVLDSKLSLTALTSPQREALAPELAAAKREIELLRIEADNYRREVEDCRKTLSSSLEANSRLTKQLDELSAELREVKYECKVQQEELQKLRDQALDIEAIEWGHAQHVELISNLKIKLQQSEERSEREANMRSEVDEQLNASLQKAADLHAVLEETRGALDEAEMLVSRLQSAESSLSIAQEVATLAQNVVRQIHLETKEMSVDQRLSLKHIEGAAVAARMKESELLKELNEAHSLIEKLSSTKEEAKCLRCGASSPTKDEQVHVVVEKGTVTISQLEKDLLSLDLLSESRCTPLKTSSIGTASDGLENVAEDYSETLDTQGEQPSDLEHSSNCIVKLNFAQEEDERTENGASLETSERELGAVESVITESQEVRTLPVNYVKSVDVDTMSAIRSLVEEIVKLKPQVAVAEQSMAAAKLNASELINELQSSMLVIKAVQEESKNWAAQSEALLKEKDMAARARQEWEVATARLLENLHEGEHALTDAVREMEGILDDSLNQPTALDIVREREHLNLQQFDMTTPDKAKQEDADQNERAKGELGDKDCLISNLQLELERATVNLVEKDLLISRLQLEQDRDREHVREADAQVVAAVSEQSTLPHEIEKHRLELTTVSKRMEDTELDLAHMQDVWTGVPVELCSCERKEELIAEKVQFAAASSCATEQLERSCAVATTMVWWLQNKISADGEAQKLNYERLTSQVSDQDRMIMNLREEVTEKTTLLKGHTGNEEILTNQNLKQMQEINHTRNEIRAKDTLLGVMQTNALRLQEELSASEDRSLHLTMDKEKLQIQLSESAEISRALEEALLRVQKDLQEAEAKVVELAVAQAGILIVQEQWGLEKGALERATREAQQKCIQLEQELELARQLSQKCAIELEEAKAQETLQREETDAAVTKLHKELKRTQISAEDFKNQLEVNQRTTAELDSRLQKHLTDWEIEKEAMVNAAMISHDQCLEKSRTLISVQVSHTTLQSQLHDTCSREAKLSHELEEVLQVNESTISENVILRSKVEELFLVVNQQEKEIFRQENDFELKLRKADEKVEDTHCQIEAILVDLDALILMKEKLEADIECIEQKSLNHCLSAEQQLVKAHEDKNQLEDLLAERENELLRELHTLKSENMSFSARIQTLEGALEGAEVLVKKKEEEVAVLRQNWTDSESKAVQTQEKLRASTLLAKDLARSEEQWKTQKEALASENKRLTRCMACREMEFSSLQCQKEDLERNLKEAHEKERITNVTLSNLKEHLKVLEKQWQVEREQLKDRLNRELVEGQELKNSFNKALKQLEEEVRATEKKSEVIISALEAEWNTTREDMSSNITKVSQEFIEVKRCAERMQLDLAKARSLLSAADTAIEQLLEKSSVLEDSHKQLLEEQEALKLELSQWERYAVDLHQSSCVATGPFNDDTAIAASGTRPFNYYFDLLKGEVERVRIERENLRAEVLDKDSTILSVQMELSCTIASSRQLENELKCVTDERSHLKLQLNDTIGALANAQEEIRCREVQLEEYEVELHKVMEILEKTEEKMDESARGWRKQIEEVKAEMEAAKLCAIEKSSEVTMLRRQFEQGQTTLQEAELLVNALVRANDSARLDVLKWKSREENMALQSSDMLSIIEDEVSVTMDHVENQMQVLGSDIHGMRTLLAGSCLSMVAGFSHEFRAQVSEIERAVEEANIELSKVNAKVIESEHRLHETAIENETLQITLTNTEELLRVSEAALQDAMLKIEAEHQAWVATRGELQGAMASLAEKNRCISESTSECDRLSLRMTELEKLSTQSSEELTSKAGKLKEVELEKLLLAEATDKLQVANNYLNRHVQQLEMAAADDVITKEVMEVEIASLRELKDAHEDKIHKLEADLAASCEAVKTTASKLLDTDSIIQALNTDLGSSRNEIMCVQRSLDKAVTELNDLQQHVRDLEEEQVYLRAQAETQGLLLKSTSDKLVEVQADSDAAIDILATILESTSSELHEKQFENHSRFSTVINSLQVAVSQLGQEKELLSEKANALDGEKIVLLERLEMVNKQLCKQSQEASAASVAQELQLEILKTIIESASSELQEKDFIISTLQEKLEEDSAQCLALDDEKKNLLEQLQKLGEQLRNQSQEACALSAAHQMELEILKTNIDSALTELQDKERVISSLREKLEEGSARCLALDNEKKHLLEQLQKLGEQLRDRSQEASALSAAHQMELEILKATIESASTELQDKDRVISALREKLEESSVYTQKMLNSLETTDLASAQVEHERDELLKTANILETEKNIFKEELENKSRKCADLEMRISSLQTELQEVSTETCKLKLELEILTTMLECAVKESREKDAMASDLENLLSQSQLQNAEMLQSSQDVVNHFSLFQSQLDACFQQNRELERSKLVLTAEVNSHSQEIGELKEQREAFEISLDEMRASFAQLKKDKEEEVHVLSDELEKLKSLEAIMEADIWDWEQRCQDVEVQLDEKDSELEILRGKLLETQEECKEQVESMYDELQGCQLRIAEMESERRDLINEIEEGSAIVAEIQEKLLARENDMEEHFSRHSIEQEVFDALENEKKELQSTVKHLTSEVAAYQQRAAAAENMQVEIRLEMEALERDLIQKDDLLQSLESDLNLLQESALQELRLNQELESLRTTTDALQQELNLQKERRTWLETEIGQLTEEIVQVRNQAATWKGKAYELETELDKKRQTIECLEDELRMAEQNMANTLEEATIDLKDVENDRDRLQVEVLELTEQLEMTQAMVEERDAVASELQQAVEVSKALAMDKENEAKLLARSVEELESTVYALESQLGLLKREAERQRLLREDIEMESQRLNNHIFVTQSALEESNIRNAEELKDALSALKETERKVEDKESEITHLRRKLENLEILSRDKDVQINDAMAQISDLLRAADVQKNDFQQKLKRMESQSGCTTPNSTIVATEVVSSDGNSSQEASSQRDLVHASCQSRIKELEEIASSRQKEVFTLHTRLAEAESMTHDVLRDLLGVKSDMNNVVSILGQQQIQQLAETARRKNEEVQEMEAELSSLRSQINTFIEERASWTEEINQRQCEMVAARAAAEKLRQKEQVLTDEIEKFRIENINHQEKIRELEMEIRKLPTGQQTFYQQINHHAKIKEENQALKLANDNLSKELRRTELLYAGMHDELKRYREVEIKSTSSSFDEQHHLRHLLQEAEDSRAQAARKLSVLCTAIMQAAGLSDSEQVSSTAAMDALHLLENRLRSTEQELSESKYKMKITGERRIRRAAKDSPLRSISNFTDLLQRASTPSPAPR
ncbi:hypothetical protein M758_9G099600 [Ceratodon purpureus]|nr:hypothetical protein M758_9G099600 [Ceratodon purpureus]